MDNGRDYQSKVVQGSLRNLEAHSIKLLPYAPEDKGKIERMMRTRAAFEEMLPGFVGHNVEQQQAIRSRRKPRGKSCRRVEPWKAKLSSTELQTEMTRYLEKVYSNKAHGGAGMGGMTPNEKWASSAHRPRRVKSREQLLISLLPAEERVMQGDGLHFDSGIYWDDSLSCEVDKPFMCRQWPLDTSLLCVSTPEPERFVCWAEDTNRRPRTAEEAMRSKRHAMKARKERYKSEAGQAGPFYGNPRVEEIAVAQDPRATVQPLHAGGPTVSGVMADMAYAAGEDLKKRQATGAATVETVLVLPEKEHYSKPNRPQLHVVGESEEEPQTPTFSGPTAPMDGLRHFLGKWRKQGSLTADEKEQARRCALRCSPSWLEDYAYKLDRDGQALLAEIVPGYFGEYAKDQTPDIPLKTQENSK